MKLPSIDTLLTVTDGDRDKANAVRAIMAGPGRVLIATPQSHAYGNAVVIDGVWHHPATRLQRIDAIIGTFGVEYISQGTNARTSPAIAYCNAGDTYAVTVLKVNGRFRVGCWGDIVERGNYA